MSLSNPFPPNPVVDKETEMLITAIENLTSRALKETGQQWESTDPNILQTISNESSVNKTYDSMTPADISKDNTGFEINVRYNSDGSTESNNVYHSYSSSGDSSNSFLPGNSQARNNENIHEGAIEHFQYREINATNISNSEEEDNTPVIRNISYANDDIKSKAPRQIDNSAEESLDIHNYGLRKGSNNNNRDTETERRYDQKYFKGDAPIQA